MSTSLLFRIAQPVANFRRNLNCWTAGITKKHRKVYERTYPTILVLPDGSSTNIEYHEPRKIITLPLDLSTLTEEERKLRIARRIKKSKIKFQEEITVDFDESRYLRFAKKK